MTNDVFFIGSDGIRRRGKEGTCEQCLGRFIQRLTWNQRFCSVVCARQARKKRMVVSCAQCTATVERPLSKRKNSKSGLQFCSRRCKDLAQRIGGKAEIQPPHYGSSKSKYRKVFLEVGGVLKCSRCGYDEFESSVQVHHKDHDRGNNKIENLLPLCANCHSGLHNGYWSL